MEDDEVQERNSSPNKWPLTNEWTKQRLIYDLAKAEITQVELAETYGVTQSAIAQFKKRNMALIEERREKMLSEYGSLWVAEKFNRLAARQNEIEKLLELRTTNRNSEIIGKHLNDIATELGELESKVSVEIAEYRITGIDLDKL